MSILRLCSGSGDPWSLERLARSDSVFTWTQRSRRQAPGLTPGAPRVGAVDRNLPQFVAWVANHICGDSLRQHLACSSEGGGNGDEHKSRDALFGPMSEMVDH